MIIISFIVIMLINIYLKSTANHSMEVTLRATRFRPFLNVFAYFILDPLALKEIIMEVTHE